MPFKHIENPPFLPDLLTENRSGKRFYITPSGEALPSVTTILSHAKSEVLTNWVKRVGEAQADVIRNVAARHGTELHETIEKYLRNEDKYLWGIMPTTKYAFLSAKPILARIDNIHHIEAPLYSTELGTAGRTDAIAEFDGELSIIDFKTSSKHKKEEWIQNYFEQATAYSLMYEEMTGLCAKQIVIIISVNDEPVPQIFVKNRDDYIDALLNTISKYKEETRLIEV